MIYVFGDFELDERLFALRHAGESLKLEPKVFDVLAYLIHRRNRFVSRDELMEKLWPGQVVSDAALTQCIAKARKAVRDDSGKQQAIKTQHGRGYRFVAEVMERDDEPFVTLRHAQGERGSTREAAAQPFVLSTSKHDKVSFTAQSAPKYRPLRHLVLAGLFFFLGSITTL